jgi:putative flippase GtrA
VVLGALVTTRAMTPGWANVVATGVGTVPSFELNRRWVWGNHGQPSWRRQVLPFVALSFAGLAISTWAVSTAGHWADASGLPAGSRTLAIEAANVLAFGTLWIAQFLILDLVLFGRRSRSGGAIGGGEHGADDRPEGQVVGELGTLPECGDGREPAPGDAQVEHADGQPGGRTPGHLVG